MSKGVVFVVEEEDCIEAYWMIYTVIGVFDSRPAAEAAALATDMDTRITTWPLR